MGGNISVKIWLAGLILEWFVKQVKEINNILNFDTKGKIKILEQSWTYFTKSVKNDEKEMGC